MPCTGTSYLVNPDAPEEGTDIRHNRKCTMHGVTEFQRRDDLRTGTIYRPRTGEWVWNTVEEGADLIALMDLAYEIGRGQGIEDVKEKLGIS